MARRYPAVWALAFVIVGIATADISKIPAGIFLFLAVIFTILLIFFYYRGQKTIAVIFGLLSLMILSAFGFSFRYLTFPPGHIVHFTDDGNSYAIFGEIVDWPVVKEHQTRIIIKADSIGFGGMVRDASGRILVKIQMETTNLQYGDRIYFDSEIYMIRKNSLEGGLGYQRYLNLKEVFGVCYLPHYYNIRIDHVGVSNLYRLINDARTHITNIFKKTLDAESAALASGFLYGDTREISLDIYRLFRDSGTLHLLAVSGSNVGLVVLFFVFILRASPCRTNVRIFILLIVILIFSFLAYNQPSVVRASLMASLVLIGKLLQKRVELNNIIAFTALVILLVQPTQLYDIGFQLSFATAWGLIFFVPRLADLTKISRRNVFWRYALYLLLTSLIAQIISLPIIAYYFHRVPLVSFVSNLLIVPLVSLIVIGEVILLPVTMLLPVAGIFLGSLLNPILHIVIFLLELFGSSKYNLVFNAEPNLYWLVVYYSILILIFLSIQSKRTRRLAAFAVLAALCLFMGADLLKAKDRYDFLILPAQGGLAAVSNISGGQLILMDMPQKDYLISEKILHPYFENNDFMFERAISLSGNYSSVKELCFWLENELLLGGYIPDYAHNIFLDLMAQKNLEADSVEVTRFGFTPLDSNFEETGILLRENILIYNIDSNLIIFAADLLDLGELSRLLSGQYRSATLIKPMIGVSDLENLHTFGRDKCELVICYKLSPKADDMVVQEPVRGQTLPQFVKISQLGEVGLVIGQEGAAIKK